MADGDWNGSRLFNLSLDPHYVSSELLSETSNLVAVDEMAVVLEIEWNVARISCDEDDELLLRMSISDLVEDVRISAGHVGNDEVG